MKLKNLLEENEVEKSKKRLKDKLATGNWIYERPKLYRGKDTNKDYPLFSVKETKKRKDTRHTSDVVDTLIHGFYEYCHPEYPSRRKSRFATNLNYKAKIYGDTVFVVLPHQNDSKISYYHKDPYDMFEDMLENYCGVDNSALSKHYNRLSDNVQDIVDVLIEIKRYDAGYTVVDRLPCPKKGLEILRDEELVISNKNHILPPLKNLYAQAYQYFRGLELGYPLNGAAGEIIFQGKYLEVRNDIFEEVVG